MNHDDTEGVHSDDPRIVLQRLIESRGVDYSALSRRLGVNYVHGEPGAAD